MTNMTAIEMLGPGGPEVLRLGSRERPPLGTDDVLIRVKASGINRPDLGQRKGNYPPPPGVTEILGLEVAGEIVEGNIAHHHNRFGLAIGSRVCALAQGGGYAEYCAVPWEQVMPVPEGFSDIEAAALPENYFTVWSNVFDRGQLGKDRYGEAETLLVQGGASGIGTTAIQIAAALGHLVFATAGTNEKARLCERLGAVRGINYRDEDFVSVVKAATGRGVDVVLDMVGGSYVAREIACTADDGRIVLIATLGGAEATLSVSDILRRRITLTGSTLRPRSAAFKGAIASALHKHVWPLLASRRIAPVIHQIYAPRDAALAHRYLEEGTHAGKLVLDWTR